MLFYCTTVIAWVYKQTSISDFVCIWHLWNHEPLVLLSLLPSLVMLLYLHPSPKGPAPIASMCCITEYTPSQFNIFLFDHQFSHIIAQSSVECRYRFATQKNRIIFLNMRFNHKKLPQQSSQWLHYGIQSTILSSLGNFSIRPSEMSTKMKLAHFSNKNCGRNSGWQ